MQKTVRKEGHDLESFSIAEAFVNFCVAHEWAVLTTRQIELRLRDLMLEIHRSAYANRTRRAGDTADRPRGGRGYKNVAFKPKTGEDPEDDAENYTQTEDLFPE
jgi:hypothetical protein